MRIVLEGTQASHEIWEKRKNVQRDIGIMVEYFERARPPGTCEVRVTPLWFTHRITRDCLTYDVEYLDAHRQPAGGRHGFPRRVTSWSISQVPPTYQ